MKLSFVELDGFRGYRRPLRIDFAPHFTVIDGRNGVGKSTIFDAIEFALTGAIGKYTEQKAAGETFADYVWWRGEGAPPAKRFVRVGFTDEGGEIVITRSEFDGPDSAMVERLISKLCDRRMAPPSPLGQLCTNAIVRDELITKLSLDLRETDRYALLRDALGANDSDSWIERAARIMGAAKRRAATLQGEVLAANSDVTAAARRLDELRASLVAETALAQAIDRLQKFTQTQMPPDQLASPVRERIAVLAAEIESLEGLIGQWPEVSRQRARIDELDASIRIAKQEKQAAEDALTSLPAEDVVTQANALAEDARRLIVLVGLGRQIGVREGHCPLCAKEQTAEEFARGTRTAEELARRLNEGAARTAVREQEIAAATARVMIASRSVEAAESARSNATKVVQAFVERLRATGFSGDIVPRQIQVRIASLRDEVEAAQKDLRVLETLKVNLELEKGQRAESDAKTRLTRSQERLGRALKAEAAAHALHDAARRAASETLDRRLERVLPLMSELYRRLRPHAVWSDIEYAIRGDVRRFLTLQVGEDLNPQFLFSSGQRRATGLAFLLSVNLSLAWSKWRTILLDDPVQHVDDYRAVHLAELLSQLVSEGRQVICAVEDAALADLLCRRMPVTGDQTAKRITLGSGADGSLAKVSERTLALLVRHSVVPVEGPQLQAG